MGRAVWQTLIQSKPATKCCKSQNFHQVLDLIAEDDPASVHAGEVEVRPPPAPHRRRTSAEARLAAGNAAL